MEPLEEEEEPVSAVSKQPLSNASGSRRRSLRLASKSRGGMVDEAESVVAAGTGSLNHVQASAGVERRDVATLETAARHQGHSSIHSGVMEAPVVASSSTRKRKMKSCDLMVENTGSGLNLRSGKILSDSSRIQAMGTGKSVCQNLPMKNVCVETFIDGSPSAGEIGAGSSKKKFTRDEKGKGLMVVEDLQTEASVAVELTETPEAKTLLDVPVPVQLNIQEGQSERILPQTASDARTTYLDRFRNIAKRNAVRFAHFNPETIEDSSDASVESDTPEMLDEIEAEDWPGPFSTAMKIIKDRANKSNAQHGSSAGKFSSKVEALWVPKQTLEPRQPKSPPSLEDLSMEVLVRNSSAISSLNSVPDLLRRKLCETLSDCRRMNSHLFKLLLSGSPTEVCIRDSSWLTEEEFMEHFAECDTTNLMVLQLDQCGRCMPDYVMHATLAQSSNSLPALVALSVQAACRFSDSGLYAIISAAPRLQSINLSQCSLITSSGINCLTISLGSVLRELYIDDCQNIDIMQCLPGLKEVKCLEVLSIAGIESVCDEFIKHLMVIHGLCLKELILTNCVKLTDCSLKAIADNSFSLRALNLVNISNLTDIGIGYLANGILKFQMLKFCRNSFSDEALAAFLETCGDSLEELWLNNIKAVAS
uniref:Rad7 n=1 Tax=Kalanchoe fedtschenkoi TaxID=63787 RepID=A0A7N0V056_KALFE